MTVATYSVRFKCDWDGTCADVRDRPMQAAWGWSGEGSERKLRLPARGRFVIMLCHSVSVLYNHGHSVNRSLIGSARNWRLFTVMYAVDAVVGTHVLCW